MANGNFNDAPTTLILLSGLPGTGKTTFARALASRLAFVHVESDAIRRRIAEQPTYTPDESARVFGIVEARARAALSHGEHALVDATNLTHRDRKRFLRLAATFDARLIAIRLTAPETVLRERLSRPREGFSQAGIAVYERMKARPQPLRIPSLVVDSSYPFGPAIDLLAEMVNDQSE